MSFHPSLDARPLTWLLVARRARGMTQTELAAKVGISQVHLSRIENGVREPRLETARALARELRLDIDTLFPTTDDRSPMAVLENELVKQARRNRKLRQR